MGAGRMTGQCQENLLVVAGGLGLALLGNFHPALEASLSELKQNCAVQISWENMNKQL